MPVHVSFSQYIQTVIFPLGTALSRMLSISVAGDVSLSYSHRGVARKIVANRFALN